MITGTIDRGRMVEVKDALTDRPSFGSPALDPESGRLAYWWNDGSRSRSGSGGPTLRLHDLDAGEIEDVTIEDDEFALDGGSFLHWLGDRFLVQGRPEVYEVDLGGTVEEVPIGEQHTAVHDVDASGRILYTHYTPRESDEPWTLRIHDPDAGSTTILTEHPEQLHHAGFSPDGRRVAYRENPTETFGGDRIVVADADGSVVKTSHVGDAGSRSRLYGWHPDGERFLLDDRSTGWYRVGLHDWRADETTWYGTGEYNEFPVAIMPDDERVVTRRFRDGCSVALVYDSPDAEPRELDLPEGLVSGGTRGGIENAPGPDRLLLQHQTPTRPPRLLEYDLETDETRTIADTAAADLDRLDLADAAHVTYESTDGLDVNAILYRAHEEPSPAVVYVHGGPDTAEYRGFDPLSQYLVSEGYAVLKPNYRGSTDRGRSFQRALRGEFGDGDVDDVATGARWLAEKSYIDPDRMAVFGHSYGAYVAAMAAVRYPELWQVVIPENGAGGLDAVEGFGDPNQYTLRHLIEDPERETAEEFLRERSPLHRIDDVGCPVCLVYGEHDPGVETGRAFVEGLKARGWTEGEEFRFEVVAGEGHVIGDEERFWPLVSEVLDQYLGDG